MRHETQQDLKNEQLVVEFLSGVWNCQSVKLDDRYYADYLLTQNNSIVAVVEIKCRNIPFSRFKDMICSAKKRMHCNALADAMDVKSLLVTRFSDGEVKYLDMLAPVYKSMMLQDDRNRNSKDLEPHVSWVGDCIKTINKKC